VIKSPREEPSCPATCDARCCRYLVKRIASPRTKYDFDELYWMLCHEKVAVFVQGRRWHLLVEVPCQHLGRNRTCRIYPLRPLVCRLHSSRNCEGAGEIGFEEFLLAPQDLLNYMRSRGISYRVPWMEGGSRGGEHGQRADVAGGAGDPSRGLKRRKSGKGGRIGKRRSAGKRPVSREATRAGVARRTRKDL